MSNFYTAQPYYTNYVLPPQSALLQKPVTQSSVPKKTTRVKSLYANDFHSHLDAFAKLKTESDVFRAKNKKQNVRDLIVIGGDSYVGGNEPRNNAVIAAMNLIMPDANVPGNHEFDWRGSLGLSRRTDKQKFKTLALNVKMKPGCELEDDYKAGRLATSTVIEKDGEKFGMIGLVPADLFLRVSQQTKDYCKDFEVMNMPETIKAVQAEVDKLEKQGINKIALVSHMGYDADVAMAKLLNGVDVIYGAHSHDILPGIVPKVNYFISKRGEPVIITQAGKNGHHYGILDVVYDENGKIINAKNTIKKLDESSPSLLVELAKNILMGKPKVIGQIASEVPMVPESELKENPIASFMCDGYKKYTGADIILMNQGSIRSGFHKGPITDEQIREMMPYYNEVWTYKFSEKEIIDTLNNAVKATRKYNRTGAVQVAGMEYTIGKDDKLKNVSIVKDDGTKIPVDAKNPRADKFYTVAYNAYLFGGPEGLENLHAPEKRIAKCDRTETQIVIDYVKSFENKPIKIEATGRIKYET